MTDDKHLVVSLPDDDLTPLLGALPEPAELVRWPLDGPAPRSAIDIAVLPLGHADSVFAWLPGVRIGLLQSQSNGFDGVREHLPPGTVYANAASVHETATAELALTLMLAAQRGIPEFVLAAQAGQWRTVVRPTLADATVLLVGYGGVGRAIEARVAPFEATVIRVARTARADERGFVYGMEDLPRLLGAADIVVLALPLTASSRGLADDGFLSRMRDGALLVNVGRGPTVDTEALLEHVKRGRIRAALDVTDPEPLPAGHPLFALPGVLITPHVGGGATTAAAPRMARLLREQVNRALRGEQPLNVVLRT